MVALSLTLPIGGSEVGSPGLTVSQVGQLIMQFMTACVAWVRGHGTRIHGFS